MTVPSAMNVAATHRSQATATPNGKSMSRESASDAESEAKIDIIDIRQDAVQLTLKEEIFRSLKPKVGPRRFPTLLLYDERGLQLFEEITYLSEYYLTNAEIDVLQRSSHSIAKAIPSGSMVVELGSGNLRKVSILLQALEAAEKDVDYYALDLSLRELKRTLEQVPAFKHVRCHGLHGTYDDGLDWLKLPEYSTRPKCVMSLGSSIGNFQRPDAATFLKGFADVLGASDSMLIGLDGTEDAEKVYHAYNDCQGTTHNFILNGLHNANEILGEESFKLDDWEVIGEYVYDGEGGRHQAFLSPTKDVDFRGTLLKARERIQVEQSLKYSETSVAQLWKDSALTEVNRWTASRDAYNIYLLTKEEMPFTTDPRVYAASTVPTMADWTELWAVWDTVTKSMIKPGDVHEKPIKLRNANIFYLGHIPTFLDIQLSKATTELSCGPASYVKIFERGIDPDVDNPEHCHAHSKTPDEWPPLEEILAYQDRVRARVKKLSAMQPIPRNIGRALWIGFEHEVMHLETLLYMLLQSDKTLPPTTDTPDFAEDAKRAEAAAVPNDWFQIPEQTITIGLDDPEDNSGGDQQFGWDNEKPSRKARVKSFEAQGRPITNKEYAQYLEQTHNSRIPASWASETLAGIKSDGNESGVSHAYQNGSTTLTKAYLEGKAVRTVYGLVPLEYALHWPVFASYDELAGCAAWMGGRIPSLEEARSIYSHADGLKLKEAERHLGKTVPAVNGHLVNDGVEESPPQRCSLPGGGSQELFTNLEGANVGFKNWHPVAVTANGNKLGGQADMGGVWEWTSSELIKHKDFEPMALYPAYTADFFDGKHNVILGGSWATHPRVAGRKTFVNWYQRNYPYTWAGARLVRDL